MGSVLPLLRITTRPLLGSLLALAWLAAHGTGRGQSPLRTIQRCGVIDLNQVAQERGYAYVLTYFATGGDGPGHGRRSPVLLFEDSIPLDAPHSPHDDIRNLGGGRYSHWGFLLRFSASDNSDPRVNGRAYTWGVPADSQCPVPICGQVDRTRIRSDSGVSFFLPENFGFPGDEGSHPDRSSLRLFEGESPLGPPHSATADVRVHGQGRFRHWENGLYFSASDNSDPRSNSRTYYYGGACRKLADVRLTQLAAGAPFFATFGSYNQRILDLTSGLYVALLTRMYPGSKWSQGNPLDTRSDWRLLRSLDQGATFETAFSGQAGTHVSPVLDADRHGAVYVIGQQFTALTGADATVLRFDPAVGFAQPDGTTLRGLASDKFTTAYDSGADRFYYVSTSYSPGHPARLAKFSAKGDVQVGPPVVTQGSHGFLMYPLLSLDGDNLYLAWTAQALPAISSYLYWDIHFLVSRDQGRGWANPGGVSLHLPVLADSDGPAERVTLPEETGTHPWLSGFLARGGLVYFVYNTSRGLRGKHFRRFSASTASFDVDASPIFRGNRLVADGQGGFLLSGGTGPHGMLYFVGESVKDQRVVVLASDDAGLTWFDYAVTRPRFTSLYSVSGPRAIGPSGRIYAVFTDLKSKDESQNANDVWLMSVSAE
jgi:hypothetical protein